MNAREAAEWMIHQIELNGFLRQRYAAVTIGQSNPELVYRNKNGNPALSKDVLAEFSKLKTDSIVWNRKSFVWRKVA